MSEVLARAMITPDGTVLQTFSGHDYKEYQDKNGEYYMIDGGPSKYGRSSVNTIEPKHIYITTDSPYEDIRKWFCWGTYGKSGNEKLKMVPLKDLTSDHIEAIINTQTQLKEHLVVLFKKELAYRLKEEIENELPTESVDKKSKKKI